MLQNRARHLLQPSGYAPDNDQAEEQQCHADDRAREGHVGQCPHKLTEKLAGEEQQDKFEHDKASGILGANDPVLPRAATWAHPKGAFANDTPRSAACSWAHAYVLPQNGSASFRIGRSPACSIRSFDETVPSS